MMWKGHISVSLVALVRDGGIPSLTCYCRPASLDVWSVACIDRGQPRDQAYLDAPRVVGCSGHP